MEDGVYEEKIMVLSNVIFYLHQGGYVFLGFTILGSALDPFTVLVQAGWFRKVRGLLVIAESPSSRCGRL